jgi:hypothetical protein
MFRGELFLSQLFSETISVIESSNLDFSDDHDPVKG